MDHDLFLWSDRNNNKHPLTNLQSNNCDFKNPEKFSDVATITQMDLLPITSVSYGPITYEFQAANATISPLICYPLHSQWNMFDQIIENEKNIEEIHIEFIEMKEGFEKKIDENEVKIGENEVKISENEINIGENKERVDANQEKIDVVQKAITEMKEGFENQVEALQEDILENMNSTLNDLVSFHGDCLEYNILNEKERNHMFTSNTSQYWCDKNSGSHRKSNQWHGSGWYRMMAPAGTKMPKVAKGNLKCGTYGSGWMQGSHPVNHLETVTRKVCFSRHSGSGSPCTWTSEIKVRNCSSYYLYYLVDTPYCNFGYCAQ